MKRIQIPLFILIFVVPFSGIAQNLSARTNEMRLDFSRGPLTNSDGLPRVEWSHPKVDYTSSEDHWVKLSALVSSPDPLAFLTLTIGDDKSKETTAIRTIEVPGNRTSYKLHQSVWLPEGSSFVKISATNSQGVTVHESRSILVGKNAFENVLDMDRKDLALIFATDRYEEWDDLVNPIDDAHSIAKELEDNYGFRVEIVENATKEQVWEKIRDYADLSYHPQDQLMIFFAGHGHYDETFGEGYVVPTNAKRNDVSKTSYISHNRLRSNIDNIKCKHLLLAMDVCFGGTFDPVLSRSRALEDYSVPSNEMVVRKLSMRTRKYITSGGKEYVSDGIPGQHSPFAAKMIKSLRTRGGEDRVLTLSELKSGMENLILLPRFGSFGSDEPGSDFVFIAK